MKRDAGKQSVLRRLIAGRSTTSIALRYRGPFKTASAIEPEPVLLEAFGELRQGDLEGLTAAQAIERYPDFFEVWARDPANAPVPGGETLGECAARARHALDRLCRVHAGDQAILVVTHQMVMASLTCYASDEPLKKWREFCVDNTAGTVLSWNGLSLSLEISGWQPSTGSG